MTCSIGVSVYPRDGVDGETLLRNADIALYRAKELGRDNFQMYTAGIGAGFRERLSLQDSLRNAIDKNQFTLFYQPKVDLASGRISGLEALLRWHDPAQGLVTPAQFIPALEETGMIVEVGQWIFQTAAADRAHLLSKELRAPRIAVNISQRQLRRDDFVHSLQAATAGTNAGEWLDLEITESLIMENVDENATKLRMIREMGVGIAIDDFGTGYSSLAHLARLPASELKIDRSFIAGIATSPEDHAVVQTIIALGHSLKLKVTAEGVESEEQAKLLGLLKCDELQGYLISRPAPLADIEGLIRQSCHAVDGGGGILTWGLP